MPGRGKKETKQARENRIAGMKNSPLVQAHIKWVNELNLRRYEETKNERNHKRAMKKLSGERKKRARGRPSDILGVALKGNPRYSSLWYSTINPQFTVTCRTLLVIKFGRPRDPWGAFMKPKDPHLLFGQADLHPDQRFVIGDPQYDCNPTQAPVQDGVPGPDVRPSSSPGGDGTEGAGG